MKPTSSLIREAERMSVVATRSHRLATITIAPAAIANIHHAEPR
jgi:hypothetical protein